MEVPHTQRFDVLVPNIVIYTSCYLLNCKKKRRCLKLTSPLEIAADVAELNKHKFRNYAYYTISFKIGAIKVQIVCANNLHPRKYSPVLARCVFNLGTKLLLFSELCKHFEKKKIFGTFPFHNYISQ